MSEKNRILFSTKKQKTTKLLTSSKTNELTKGDAYFNGKRFLWLASTVQAQSQG